MTILDTPRTETTTVTLPYRPDTLAGIYAAAQSASKDDMTPAICTVRVDHRTFLATDRYTVGEWTHDAEGDESAPFVLVPRTAAEWLAKQLPKTLGYTVAELTPRVGDSAGNVDHATISFTGESVTINYRGAILATTRFAEISANFPPVARLFPSENDYAVDALPVRLAPDHLNKCIRAVAKAGDKHEPLTFQFTKTASAHKPGPVLVTFGTRYRALILPNLILR